MGSRSGLRCALLACQRLAPGDATSAIPSLYAFRIQRSPTLALAGVSPCSTCPCSASPSSLSRGFAASARLPGGPEVSGHAFATPCPRLATRDVPTVTRMPCMQSGPAAAAKQGRLHWSFLLIPAGVAAFLGSWQVSRRGWKVEQIRQREAALQVGLAQHCTPPGLQAAPVGYTLLDLW